MKPVYVIREEVGVDLDAVARAAAHLADVIDDGQTITITASRVGLVIVLRAVQVGASCST